MLRNIWKDPVWSKVIATGILSTFALAGTYFLNLWPKIAAIISLAIDYIGSSTGISNWLLLLMASCTLMVAFFLIIVLWHNFISGPSLKDYRKDIFFNLTWHWSYGYGHSICDLYSCCPNCQYQVFPQNVSDWNAIHKIAFNCDSCGTTIGPFNDDEASLESKVERHIQKNLRTGEWANRINS